MPRFVLVFTLLAAGIGEAADDGPLSRVSYTEARERVVSRELELPGTVEAPKSSRVASGVEGIVVQLLVREGQHVKKGAPLAVLRTDGLELDLASATADLREAAARLSQAQNNRERAQELFDKQILSREQLDEARFEFDAWRGRVDRLDAEIKHTELLIELSTIRAPFAGVVTSEATEVGEWIGKGATVVEMLSPYVLEVRVDVPERFFAEMRTGSTATVKLESLPGYAVPGRVTSVVPKANDASRTFPMKIRIVNDEQRIGAGMLAKVLLTAGDSRSAQLVPKDAVITRGNDRFVYILDEEQTVSVVPVTTGMGSGDWIEVDGPLSKGARVVTRGNERIRPGQKVLAELLTYSAP